MAGLTAERLRELLHYDPLTGVFTWIKAASNKSHARPGDIAGGPRKDGYWRIGVDGARYLLHRLAWLYMTGAWPVGLIDHRDTDPSNNRWLNIVDESSEFNQENQREAHSNSQSGILGVWPCGSRWRVAIRIHGKGIHLGRFDTKPEGQAVYLAAKRAAHRGNTL